MRGNLNESNFASVGDSIKHYRVTHAHGGLGVVTHR